MMVTHCDTVHEELPETIDFDEEQNILTSPEVLGADDRAGVFAIFEILESGLKPHVLFTSDEEIGSLRAKCFLEERPCPNVNYIIQLDRRGAKDAVFYGCTNPSFISYMLNFGSEHARDTSTDMKHLCLAWDIAGVNLSIGFGYEHTNQECLNINWMYDTIHKATKMIVDCPEQQRFFLCLNMQVRYKA